MLQPTDKSTTHAKPFLTDADLADFKVQLKCMATIYFLSRTGSSAQSYPGTGPPAPPVVASRNLYGRHPDNSTGATVYSASREATTHKDHISHLLFNLVLCHHDAHLWDTFPVLTVPTKHLLCSHQLNSRQLSDDKTCTSTLETFTCASNISLPTHGIKSCSAPTRRPSSSHANHHRCLSSPHTHQLARDSS